MKLVVDTNVLFSFFRKESKTRELILNFEVLKLYTPSFCIDELKKYEKIICKKSGLSKQEFSEVLEDMMLFIRNISVSEYKKFLLEAKKFSPDPDDIDIFALSLKLNCPIWSNEKRFKNQSKVKIFSTYDLVKLLEL